MMIGCRSLAKPAFNGSRHRPDHFSIGRLGGFHTDFAELPRQLALNTAADYENYLARLTGFKAYVEQYIELMRNSPC